MMDATSNDLLDETAVLHAADTWQVEGFSVWDAVSEQITAETPEPVLVHADTVGRALYETDTVDTMAFSPSAALKENNPNVELLALVRELKNEVALLRSEVDALKRQQSAAKPIPPRPVMPARPLLPTVPSLFPLGTPSDF